MSKNYTFTISRGTDQQSVITVNERELTKTQKSLLLGEAVKRYKDLTEELQKEFLWQLFLMKDEKRIKAAEEEDIF